MLYYHRVAITAAHGRQVVLVKCRVSANNSTLDNIVKRDVLPPEFVEPEYVIKLPYLLFLFLITVCICCSHYLSLKHPYSVKITSTNNKTIFFFSL